MRHIQFRWQQLKMARKSPSAKSLKLLYVRSGNECAYPNCYHPIFNDNGLYISELCHIKAANKGGPRFDLNQTDKERKSNNNLLFLCHRHHKETDNLSIEQITDIKSTHESKYTESGKELSKDMGKQIIQESNRYWDMQLNKTFDDLPELKIERDFNSGIFELFGELESHITWLQDYCDLCAESDNSKNMRADLINLFEKLHLDFSNLDKLAYDENPFISRNWEMHNLGNPNTFAHISLCVNQLKVKTTEELLKLNPDDQRMKEILEEFRKDFDSDYNNSYYID